MYRKDGACRLYLSQCTKVGDLELILNPYVYRFAFALAHIQIHQFKTLPGGTQGKAGDEEAENGFFYHTDV